MTHDQASPLPSDAPSPQDGLPGPTAGRATAIDPFLIVGVLGIWLMALVMRLWQLDQFDAPVFDEVYFPEFAQNYLDDKSFYDVHPPLGKYLIAVAILLFGRNEFGFRIMPALFGSLIPVLVAGVAYRLSYQRTFALLAGALMLTDGLFLVESRYGLINVFLVVFGFAAQIFLLVGLEQRGMQRAGFFMLSGLMLGASVAVKWNGLWFAFMFGGLGLLIWILAAQVRNLLLLGLGMLVAGGLGWFAEGEAAPTALQILQPFAHPLWFGMALVILTLAAGSGAFPKAFVSILPKWGSWPRLPSCAGGTI
ncbi:MAG: phospholipid carrier-dependent glycosyltransferase [Synechococcaceae cyanobacterium SM2_3_1]|nr:phospholipid carrier-dependent glycosyltransferase [Synechococcaceae cyanobacterium SM2_3_1]